MFQGYISSSGPIPPFTRDLLVSRYDDLAAGPCGQIPHDRRFQVDFGFHALAMAQPFHPIGIARRR